MVNFIVATTLTDVRITSMLAKKRLNRIQIIFMLLELAFH